MPGATAKKKRQRDDGSNYYKEHQRPEAMELCYAGCGKIDQHDRHRQHLLGLEKQWATQKWQTRMLHSVLISMTVVDAFLMCAALLPDRGLEDANGSMDTFVTKLVAQVLSPVPIIERAAHTPGSGSSNAPTANASSVSSSSSAPPPPPQPPHSCTLMRIGTTIMQHAAGRQRRKKTVSRRAM
jgi:hypothetical protein